MNNQGYVVNPGAVPQKNTVALVGFILSIVSLIMCGFLSIVPLILSIIGLCKVGKCNGDGKGFAIAGLIISIINTIIKIVMLVIFIIPLMFVPSIIESVDNGDWDYNINTTINYGSYY